MHPCVPCLRAVADVAWFLSAIAIPDPGSPLSLSDDPARFRNALDRSFKGIRVAWWKGLGGIPFEAEIRAVVEANRRVFADLGCVIEEAEPDFTGVDQAFPAQLARVHGQAGLVAGRQVAGVGGQGDLARLAAHGVNSRVKRRVAAFGGVHTQAASDRARLLDRLITSLDTDRAAEGAWMQEARHRDEEIETGAVKPVPGGQVLARLRAGLQ